MPELLVVLGFACIGIGIFVLQPSNRRRGAAMQNEGFRQ
jgi:hypothetical protein